MHLDPPLSCRPAAAGLLLAGWLAAGVAARSQEPTPEPPPTPAPATAAEAEPRQGPAAGETESEKERRGRRTDQATLKIETDLDALVTVGVRPATPLAAGETLTVEVDPGLIRVQATVTDVVEAKVVEDLTVAAGERQRLRLKMAKALADLRRIEARDRTYRDPESRLMWPTRDNGTDLDWHSAIEYCEELGHGGWQDWRLPTLDELEGIEAMWSLRPYKTADPITLSSCCSWSSDRIDEENAWNFNYRFRRAFRGHLEYSLSLRALCVRDGSDEIPENTRRNRRLARREAKEKLKEKIRRQEEQAAAEAAAAAAAQQAEEAGGDDDDSGDDGGGDGHGAPPEATREPQAFALERLR